MWPWVDIYLVTLLLVLLEEHGWIPLAWLEAVAFYVL